MKIEKVSMSIEDGTMDCVGGVRYDYTQAKYTDATEFKLKATTDDANVQITLNGYELDNLVAIVRRRI